MIPTKKTFLLMFVFMAAASANAGEKLYKGLSKDCSLVNSSITAIGIEKDPQYGIGLQLYDQIGDQLNKNEYIIMGNVGDDACMTESTKTEPSFEFKIRRRTLSQGNTILQQSASCNSWFPSWKTDYRLIEEGNGVIRFVVERDQDDEHLVESCRFKSVKK